MKICYNIRMRSLKHEVSVILIHLSHQTVQSTYLNMYHYLYVYFFRVTYNESCLGLYTKNALSSKNTAAEELTLETSLASE